MRLPSVRTMIVVNLVVLSILLLLGLDWMIRWRIGQGINSYHIGVIAPLIQPRPTSGPPQPGKP